MRRFFVVIACALTAGCGAPTGEQPAAPGGADTTIVAVPDGGGQLVYVPVYSHIYYRSAQRQMNLTATLSLRNADLAEPLIIRRVDYYDSAGELVRRYLTEPIRIGALSSRSFVVEEEDTRGGVGANFVVEWAARGPIVTPVIQAVMITTASTQGISFVTEGVPISAAPHVDDEGQP